MVFQIEGWSLACLDFVVWQLLSLYLTFKVYAILAYYFTMHKFNVHTF